MMTDLVTLPVQKSFHPLEFDSIFDAETFLEINGYECHDDIWFHNNKRNATVVAKTNHVVVQFNSAH